MMVGHVDQPVNERGGGKPVEKGQASVVEVDPSCVVPAKDCNNGDAKLGRMKAPPVCSVPELKKEAISSQELTALCFPPGVAEAKLLQQDGHQSDKFSSSSSSSSGETTGVLPDVVSEKNGDSQSNHQRQNSAILNEKVLARKTSRQGRSTQRWLTDQKTNQTIRLVTGCVPIMKDGRILFVTASRKHEWILPKGGWEIDETMEESAIRETFEEAGVIGTLGPQLSQVEYETRKARKRRLELEEMVRKNKKDRSENEFPSGCSDQLHSSEDEHQPSQKVAVVPCIPCQTAPNGDPSPYPVIGVSPTDAMEEGNHSKSSLDTPAPTRLAPKAEPFERQIVSDETSSLASDSSSTYSFVRMSLFPLYVSEVKENWPESGRFRKVLHIDDAIAMLDSRPEFRTVLKEVKEKGLHLV